MSRAGFTLLEVMVAVAILGISLTAIFSSEAGAFKVAQRAQSVDFATLLARCKLGEIAEKLARDGFPAISADGSDDCCEDGAIEGYSCKWSIERIELPAMPEGDEEGKADDEADKTRTKETLGGKDAAGTSPTDLLKNPANVETLLQNGPSALTGGGDPIKTMAMQYAYPVLKPAIEDRVRLVTVDVSWLEGKRPRSFKVQHYTVRNPNAPLDMSGGAPAPGSTASPGAGVSGTGATP